MSITARAEVTVTVERELSEEYGEQITNTRSALVAFKNEDAAVADVETAIEDRIKQLTATLSESDTETGGDADVSVSVGVYLEGDDDMHAHSWVDSEEQALTVEDIERAGEQWESDYGWDVRARYRDYIQGVDDWLVVNLSVFSPYGPLYDLVELYVDHNDFLELFNQSDEPMGDAAASLIAEGLSSVARKNGSVLSEAYNVETLEYESAETGEVIHEEIVGGEWDPDAAGLDLRNPDVHDWVSTKSDDPSASSFPSPEEKRAKAEEIANECDVEGVESIEDVPEYLRKNPFAVGLWLTQQGGDQ